MSRIWPVSSAIGTKTPGASSPRTGWRPTDERLEADDRAVGEPDDRLVVDLELVPLDGVCEVGLAREPVDRLVLHALHEDRDAAGALVLRAIHREVGAADELGAVLDADRDADAHARAQLPAAGLEGGGARAD